MDDEQITTVDGLAAALDAGEPGQAEKAPGVEQEAAQRQAAAEPHAEAQAQEGGDEAAAQEDGQANAAPSDDVVITWQAPDGSELQTPIAELKSGYMRHADYTQKTQQLAEERKQAAAEVSRQFELAQEFAREQVQLVQVQERLNTFSRANWAALYQQDPAKAGELQAQWMQLQEHGKQLAASYQAKWQQRQQERAQQFQQASAEALKTLQREIPGFGDAHIQAMREAGLAHGFSQQELAQVSDARVLQVLHEAAQWRALQAARPAVQNKVQAAPAKTTKPGAAGVPPSKREAAFKQMTARRDVESLAAFIAASE